ncbi:hypothetical protein C8R43DRAFT_919865 [Mycena crocata]|nr:hypothetical protein C8R43DRAFT_919865 [Mycena crocata]
MAEHPTRLSALDAYENVENIGDAAHALSLVVAAFLDDDLLPLDPLYTHVEPCRLALTREGELYDVLKDSHASRNFDALRRHASLRRKQTSTNISTMMEELRPDLIDLANQEELFPPWQPDPDDEEMTQITDDNLRAHVTNLKIPATGQNPCMLLHNLGSFYEDPVLRKRVRGIFDREKHTFLVNASGTGKTRLTFEGLCQNWGFYFTAAVDSSNLGSKDLDRVLQTNLDFIMDSHSTSTAKLDAARKLFGRLLLSRLLVFHLFVQLAHAVGMSEHHKKMWLHAQLRQRRSGAARFGDAFDSIFHEMTKGSSDYTDDYSDDHLGYLIDSLRTTFGEDFHLFIVIDEAQATFSTRQRTFRDADGSYYPILRDVMDSLAGQFSPHEVAMVVAGIRVPPAGFEKSTSATRHRWCSDTGAFDDQLAQREYVSRFLPPTFTGSEAGERFLSRVWRWCRGRYRATDSLLATLIRDGFQSPHQILDDFVFNFTEYHPTDNREASHAESSERQRAPVLADTINCTAIGSASFLRSMLQDVLFGYLLTGKSPRLFGPEFGYLANTSFGRYVDSNLTQIILDEPLMLVTIVQWFSNELANKALSPTCLDFLRFFPPNSTALPKVLAMYLTRAFTEPYPISRVFSFAYPPVPSWANQRAELDTLHQSRSLPITGVSLFSAPLAVIPETLEDTISWLSQEAPQPTAFCLPTTETDHPDLICVLKLASGAFIRVICVTAGSDKRLEGADLRKIIKRMDFENLFLAGSSHDSHLNHQRAIEALEKLPPHPHNVRCPRVLKVVASFPSQTHLKTATNKRTRGIANLNTRLFRTILGNVSAADLFRDIINSITAENWTFAIPPPNTERRTRSSKRHKIS